MNISEETKNRIIAIEKKMFPATVNGIFIDPTTNASDEEIVKDFASLLEEFQEYTITGVSDRFKKCKLTDFKLN